MMQRFRGGGAQGLGMYVVGCWRDIWVEIIMHVEVLYIEIRKRS